MDLQQLFCAFGFTAGGACLAATWSVRRAGAVPAVIVALVGCGLIAVSAYVLADLRRVARDQVFPIHLLDLNAPPAAIERPSPPAHEAR